MSDLLNFEHETLKNEMFLENPICEITELNRKINRKYLYLKLCKMNENKRDLIIANL